MQTAKNGFIYDNVIIYGSPEYEKKLNRGWVLVARDEYGFCTMRKNELSTYGFKTLKTRGLK